MEDLKLDANALKLLKVTQDKDLAVEALARKLEGYNTCIRFLLDIISPNVVEHQLSGVDSNFGPYEIKPDKRVRRTDLLEYNLNQLFDE